MKTLRTCFEAVLLFVVATATAGCGGTSGSTGPASGLPTPILPLPAPTVSVSVQPTTAKVSFGRSQSFSASVTGTSNTGVTWNVMEGGGSGSITNTGIFSAPQTPGTYHVLATSAADPSKTAMAIVTVAESTFTLTDSSQSSRYAQKTVRLVDGRVVVACGGGGLLASFDVFDPVTRSFSKIPANTRDSCTATLLMDGRILVAGGLNGLKLPVNPSAEILEVASGAFKNTGSMLTKRWSHTATLLPNGKVLITGGITGPDVLPPEGSNLTYEPLKSSELYDPTTGTFSATADLQFQRFQHSATLLSNGKVLILGGAFYGTPGEIYDPATDVFSTVALPFSMGTGTTTTPMADGNVLITGGVTFDSLDNTVVTAETFIFNPATGLFTTGPLMGTGRSWHTATLLQNETVLITGGAASAEPGSQYISICASGGAEIYDPVANSFATTSPMNYWRSGHMATLLRDGGVLVTGGANDCGAPGAPAMPVPDAAEIYYGPVKN